MSESTKSSIEAAQHLLAYFDQQVLAAYRAEPQKYAIATDSFEGTLTVTSKYYSELGETGGAREYLNIRFGYRTLQDGNLAIVVWLPDLKDATAHQARWMGFHLKNPTWTEEQDERFENWAMRYLEGSWDVDNGPRHYLEQTMNTINGLTGELVGCPLYKYVIDESLSYPSAQNTHRYQDAHKELYGYLIDGLDKQCIAKLAGLLKNDVKVDNKNTIKAITDLFPELGAPSPFYSAVNLVSEQRRLASHGVRPPAETFSAFSIFTNDLSLCLQALRDLLAVIELTFGVNAESAYKRQDAMKRLPHIDRPSSPYFSIVQASQMVGKTIEKVEYGFREDIKGVHGSEAMIVYFTDGSIMGIETGSNVGNIVSDENGLSPEDFHVSFSLGWVPALSKFIADPSE
jgi:hypothetical protein